MKSVYSAVRTGSLNKAVCASSLKRLKNIGKNEKPYESYKKELKRKKRARNFGVDNVKVESACEGKGNIIFIM
jgi:hypothetical protein